MAAAHGRDFKEGDDALGAEDEVGGGGGAGGDGRAGGGFGGGRDDTEVAICVLCVPMLLFGHDGWVRLAGLCDRDGKFLGKRRRDGRIGGGEG